MAYLQECLFLVEHYFREGGNYSDAMKQLFHERFPRSEVPSEDAVCNVIEHFMRTGTVHQATIQPELNSPLCRKCYAVLTKSKQSNDEETGGQEINERTAIKKRAMKPRLSITEMLKRKAIKEEQYDSDGEASDSSVTMINTKKSKQAELDTNDLWTELSEDDKSTSVNKPNDNFKHNRESPNVHSELEPKAQTDTTTSATFESALSSPTEQYRFFAGNNTEVATGDKTCSSSSKSDNSSVSDSESESESCMQSVAATRASTTDESFAATPEPVTGSVQANFTPSPALLAWVSSQSPPSLPTYNSNSFANLVTPDLNRQAEIREMFQPPRRQRPLAAIVPTPSTDRSRFAASPEDAEIFPSILDQINSNQASYIDLPGSLDDRQAESQPN